MKLAELERYFARVVTSTSGPPADLEDVFEHSPHLPATALLAIYNRGYHYRLLGTLASVFARTQRALGEGEFERLGLEYIASYPSDHPAIERIGRFFPEFLGRANGVNAPVAGLAALEWARLRALVAPNPSAVASAADIEPSRFPDCRLSFVPSLSVLSIRADSLALFAQSSSPETAANADVCGVAVWRRRDTVRHEALVAREQRALALALTGASVSHFCAAFDTGDHAADAEHAFRVVSGWFGRDWIAQILRPPSADDEAPRLSE